jgi:hypothetical protein
MCRGQGIIEDNGHVLVVSGQIGGQRHKKVSRKGAG